MQVNTTLFFSEKRQGVFIRAGTFMRINTVEDGKLGREIRRVRLNLLQLSWRFGPRYLTLLHSERPK